MPLRKKNIQGHSRTSTTGKAVGVSSYSREDQTTPNQEAGEPDPLHNQVISMTAPAGENPGPIEYDPMKLKAVAPAFYAQIESRRVEVNSKVAGIIQKHQQKVQQALKAGLKKAV